MRLRPLALFALTATLLAPACQLPTNAEPAERAPSDEATQASTDTAEAPAATEAALAAAEAGAAIAPPAPDHDWGTTFERIAVVGSSSTAGFQVQTPGGAAARLADFLDAALEPEHTIAYDGGDLMMFLNPEALGGVQIQRALAADPTLLVGVDFLFWYFYGEGETTADRLERLEGGLAELARFDCTVVVGDLPYMIKAAGGMIPWAMMPDAEGFAPANARINEWAAARDNVVLVSLAKVHGQLDAGEAYARGSFVWDPATDGRLLQLDELHPNMPGTGALAIEILAALAMHEGATLESVARGTLEELVDEVNRTLNAF